MNKKKITLKSFFRQYKLTGIAPEHCFGVTLTDFEQIINNDFVKLGDWITLITFPESQANLE